MDRAVVVREIEMAIRRCEEETFRARARIAELTETRRAYAFALAAIYAYPFPNNQGNIPEPGEKNAK